MNFWKTEIHQWIKEIKTFSIWRLLLAEGYKKADDKDEKQI